MNRGERALDYPLHPEEDSFADELLDGVLPSNLDWRRLVRNYPIPVLALAALGGFLVGRSRGKVVLAAVSTFASSAVARGINQYLGDEVA